ncbi:MAG: molybdenum cofactor guanylyltransferase, partial [Armatimonadetes bacterium]|nr:molybdenum cofactor guanylyltransferase [Armatimonadota bacterium]
MTYSTTPRIAVLAGGRSSRMGTDKGNLMLVGETLLARTVRLARAATGETPLVIGRVATDTNAVYLPDDVAETGPVGGLLTALRHAGGRAVLAVSCDLPALSGEAFEWLLAQSTGNLGTVTRNGEQWEPLFAVYTAAAMPLIEANIAAGKRSLHALIKAEGDGF